MQARSILGFIFFSLAALATLVHSFVARFRMGASCHTRSKPPIYPEALVSYTLHRRRNSSDFSASPIGEVIAKPDAAELHTVGFRGST